MKEINYFELVEKCASKKLDIEIANGQIAHAQILLEAMLRHGKNRVNIFTGELKKELYASDEFKIWVEIYYLISKGTLNFIIQNISNLQNHPLYSHVKQIDPEFKKIKFFTTNENSEASIYKNHFSIMDDLAYRNETDDKKVSAIANFNDIKKNKELQEIFNKFIAQSTQFTK